MNPAFIWWLSSRAYRRGLTPVAWLLKTVNYVVFRAILPYECEVDRTVVLMHRGLGTVVHPLTKVRAGARIGHGVTIAGGSNDPGSPFGAILEEDCEIGAGASVSVRWGRSLTVGRGARVGINAVVIDDVPPGAKMIAPLAQQR